MKFAKLNDRTRTSITETYNTIAEYLLHGLTYELLCTELTLTPEDVFQENKIVLLDMPLVEYNRVGYIVQGIFKYMFQRAMLRRKGEDRKTPAFIWADECQDWVSPFDYRFLSQARESKVSMIYLTQNIANLLSLIGREQTFSLLGNFGTKVFHANDDELTNEYASKLVGQMWMHMVTHGGKPGDPTIGGHDGIHPKLLPSQFVTLKTGGPLNHRIVEGYVMSGRVWEDTGTTYLLAEFEQPYRPPEKAKADPAPDADPEEPSG